jgi:hypothetical protein
MSFCASPYYSRDRAMMAQGFVSAGFLRPEPVPDVPARIEKDTMEQGPSQGARRQRIIPAAISLDRSAAAPVIASEAKQSTGKLLMLLLDRHGCQGSLAMTATVPERSRLMAAGIIRAKACGTAGAGS